MDLHSRYFDAQYVKLRNSLIPIAANFADSLAGKRKPKMSEAEIEEWNKTWNFLYHSKMDALVLQYGVLNN
jgi:hypothetical protein